MYKIDLHTHSTGSPDGGITPEQYKAVLDAGDLDCIAVTDHNRIDVAQSIQQQLGEQIIVGEEIMTAEGEIIGLYLEEVVPAGLSAEETVKRIKDQGGLVYIPHPFETMRKGLHPAILEKLVDAIDIMEVCNGRAVFQDRSEQAVVWAKLNRVIGAASSDAHGVKGLGVTYTHIQELPRKDTILTQLASGIPMAGKPSFKAILYPKYHRLRRKLRGIS